MRRWWIIHFHISGDEDPSQINLAGAVIGPVLGALGAVFGYLAARGAPEDGVRLGIAGFLTALPVSVASAAVCDMVLGMPVKTLVERIGGALISAAAGSVLAVLIVSKYQADTFLPWLVLGLFTGFLLGIGTQQYEYPASPKRRKKRKAVQAEEEEEAESPDEEEDRPRRKPRKDASLGSARKRRAED
jgi:hypothetical protein